jgi:hypothetical protein
LPGWQWHMFATYLLAIFFLSFWLCQSVQTSQHWPVCWNWPKQLARTGCVCPLGAPARRAGPQRKLCPALDANGPERTIYIGRIRRPAGDSLTSGRIRGYTVFLSLVCAGQTGKTVFFWHQRCIRLIFLSMSVWESPKKHDIFLVRRGF